MVKVNYDDGTIKFDNDWYTIEMLKSQIMDMMNSGNNRVARHARALEDLDGAMEGADSIYAVLPARTLVGLRKIMSESSMSMGYCVRDALTRYFRK